jgi:hypothetical protein
VVVFIALFHSVQPLLADILPQYSTGYLPYSTCSPDTFYELPPDMCNIPLVSWIATAPLLVGRLVALGRSR